MALHNIISLTTYNSFCLIHFIHTKPTTTYNFNLNLLDGNQATFMQSIIPHFNLNVSLCAATAEDYEDSEQNFCHPVSAYNRLKSGNECLLVYIDMLYEDNLSPLVKIFTEMRLIIQSLLSPIFYVLISSNDLAVELREAALSQDVYLPPPKVIVILMDSSPFESSQWSFYHYFSPSFHEVLRFSNIFTIPPANTVNYLYQRNLLHTVSNGYGRISTFQTFHAEVEAMYNACNYKSRNRDVTCHVTFYITHFISDRLNSTFVQKDFNYDLEYGYNRPLALCETCDKFGPPDASVTTGIDVSINVFYCEKSLNKVKISWQFLLHPFSRELWLLVISTIIVLSIYTRSLWYGMDTIWFIIVQTPQRKYPKSIQLASALFIALSIGYSTLVTSRVVAPLEEKTFKGPKELFKTHRLILTTGMNALLSARVAEVQAKIKTDLSKIVELNDTFDSEQDYAEESLADMHYAHSCPWAENYIEKVHWDGIRCKFTLEDMGDTRMYVAIRSYLTKPFIRMKDQFFEGGFIGLWYEERNYLTFLKKVSRYRSAGKDVTLIPLVPPPETLTLKSSLSTVFQFYFVTNIILLPLFLVERWVWMRVRQDLLIIDAFNRWLDGLDRLCRFLS